MIQKIFRAIFMTCLSVLFIAMLGIVNTMYQNFSQEQIVALQAQASMLAQILNIDPTLALDQLKPSNFRISLIDKQGIVLYDSFEDASRMENHLDRLEIIQAQEQKEGFALRTSSTLDQDTYNVAIQLQNGDFLRLSHPYSSFFNLFIHSLSSMFLSVSIGLLVSLWFAYRASKKIVAPINAIDPNHPKAIPTYEQLTPLLNKLEENQEQIQKQLKDLECKNREFSLLSKYMDEGLIWLGPKDNVLMANQAALAIFPNLEATQFNRLPSILKTDIEKAKKEGRYSTFFSLNQKRYHLEAHAIENESEFLGIMVLILDVSEQEEIKKRRQEFTANVTHELKTPLQTILSASELLQNGMVSAKDGPIFAQYIHTEAMRMAKMINDIIHLSKLDSFHSSKEEMISFSLLIQKVVDQMQPMAALRNISIDLHLESFSLQANPALLEDIVSCLLENAIVYNKENGWIKITLKRENFQVVFTICDGGIGIDPALHERIFERFYTVDSSHNHQGTGLGLAIVWHAVHLMSGSIHLESTLNQGSCFKVIFPLSKEKEKA